MTRPERTVTKPTGTQTVLVPTGHAFPADRVGGNAAALEIRCTSRIRNSPPSEDHRTLDPERL